MLTARLRAWAWRFHTLEYAERIFRAARPPALCTRRLFGLVMSLDVSRSNVHRQLLLEGERFVAERNLLRSCLAPGMRVLDVGANIGYYLLLFESSVGPQGSIDCFEPEPVNFAELARTVQANGFANVRLHPMAVGDETGIVSLRTGINGAVVASGEGEVSVPICRLDDLLTGPVDFLKIDVEGYEGHVLSGARRLLAEHKPKLFVEIHPGFLAPPYTVDAILAILEATYCKIDLYEIAPQHSLGEKLVSRYLGRQIRCIAGRETLLAACRQGARKEPFWALCRAR